MCGIGAIINGQTERIQELMEPIKARGEPENFNEHLVVEKTVLSCNRLKIVGRDTGRQPILNEDDTILAVMNGEIYNHTELRQLLEAKGHIFKTGSDTEVLVHGFEEWSVQLPNYLDGQFAFVIYDTIKQEYFVARDHFGIKPLYWAIKEQSTYFASELKQLTTFADNINEVLPGHFVSRNEMKKYYAPATKVVAIAPEVRIRELMDQAVKKRLNTDLPVAVFLSGGIDSTAILATARKFHKKVAAIVMGQHWESEDSDYKVAIQYCKERNIPVIARTPPTEKELLAMIPELVRITESFEPNMIKQAGLSLQLAKIAHEHGFKIVLCGEGADEIFCGYPEFLKVREDQIKSLSQRFFSDLHRTQLQRVDRTAMAYSVEVRVPFLDRELVEYVKQLPPNLKVRHGQTKWILRKAMQDRLPPYIYDRKKVVLSEGMGLKGNSLRDGLFSAQLKHALSKKDLNKLQEEYEKYGLVHSEEAHYFKHYRDCGYTKLDYLGRTVANAQHSTLSPQDICKVFKRKRFRRDEPKQIEAVVASAMRLQKTIEIVGFWGIGNKPYPDSVDKEAIEYLKELQREVCKLFPHGFSFTFIIADKHGIMNGMKENSMRTYIPAIKELLKKTGFTVLLLSDLWKKYNITENMVMEEINHKDKNWWKNISNKEAFEISAQKHNKTHCSSLAAQRYYIMRNLEKAMLEREFRGHIFQTYSDQNMQNVLPEMPTIYTYARKGWSNPPWFDEST